MQYSVWPGQGYNIHWYADGEGVADECDLEVECRSSRRSTWVWANSCDICGEGNNGRIIVMSYDSQ